jgi:hypothetical protein
MAYSAEYKDNVDFRTKHAAAMERIIRASIPDIKSYKVLSGISDKEGADGVVHIDQGDVLFRVRREACTHRDFTLRSRELSGKTSELDMIKEGYGKWFLYGWVNKDIIDDWVLVSLDAMRAAGLLSKTLLQQDNYDGKTSFVCFSTNVLQEHGCVVSSYFTNAAQKRPKPRRSFF